MKYRIAYAISSAIAWLDETVFDHGERLVRLCNWSEAVHEWAARKCCDARYWPDWVGCIRCQTVWEEDDNIGEGQGSLNELLEEAYLVRFDNDS
jgi:hypothetical protein